MRNLLRKDARYYQAAFNLIGPDHFGDEVQVELILSESSPVRAPALVSNALSQQFGFWSQNFPPFLRTEPRHAPWRLLSTKNAILSGRDGVVFFQSGLVAEEHLQFVQFARQGCVCTRSPEGVQLSGQAPRRTLRRPALLGFNAGHTNYAHWLTDQMAALVVFRDQFIQEDVDLLLPKVKDGHFVDQTAKLLGIPPSRIIWIGDEVMEVKNLYFLSYFHFGEAPKKLDFYLNRLADCAPGAQSSVEAKRIFISRPDSFSRRLLNEREIVTTLKSFDFEVFAPGLYSLADQINMFRNADIAVGPHGAGLMNFGFCKPESIALELFSEYTVQPAFWSVSSACELRYGFVVGSSFDQDWALSRHDGSWEAPFIINPADVVEALDRLGAR